MRLLIAIPVYNERRNLDPDGGPSAKLLDHILHHAGDVLLVDDGSTDGTADLLARRDDVRLLRHEVNQGYGQSLIDAFAYADAEGFDWVITMDADGQHEPEAIPAFGEVIRDGDYDLISGSRYLDPALAADLPPVERRAVNVTLTGAVNDLFDWSLTDTFCGYKAHRTSAMAALKLDEPGYAFPMQLWPRAKRQGLRITEVPVGLIYNDPNRYFGGGLDDVAHRLRHYVDVLAREVEPMGMSRDRVDDAVCAAMPEELAVLECV